MTHRRGAAVTEAILGSTLELMAATGAAPSVEQVAEAAGVDRTTIYRRWASITGLLADAVARLAASTVPLAPTGDVEADLRQLALDVAAVNGSPLGRAVLAASLASDDPDLAAARDAFWEARLAAADTLVAPLGLSPTEARRLVERVIGPVHLHVSIMRRELDPDHATALAREAIAALPDR